MTKQEIFVKKARNAHGNKYDYSKFVYTNNSTKGIIICDVHGEFLQTANKHINAKHGCKLCNLKVRDDKRRLTTKQFLTKAKKVHRNKYDYSLTKYTNALEKVKIICEEHGEFEQTPALHLSGSGCKFCSNNVRLTREQFIDKANKTHNNKYDYSKFIYANTHTKGIIVCGVHGKFLQKPADHLSGRGCYKCRNNVIGDTFRKNIEQFLIDANKIHNNKYDYSLADYKNNKTKVKIICKEHGIFEQRPDAHLTKKTGCPICKSSKGEEVIRNYLNENKINFKQQKTFDDLKSPRNWTLYYDFYLIDYNMIIEFHGLQHYKYINFFCKSKAEFNYRKKLDKIKKRYCLKNGIKCIIIPYNRINKVEEIIKENL